MLIRQPLLWIAAAVLAATVIASLQLRNREDEKPKQAAAPDLFAFVKALPQGAMENVHHPSTEDPVEGSAETTAARPAEAVVAADAFRTEEMVRQMRASGASDDEVYRARAAAMSAEKAAALARLDREEDAWHRRIAAYQAQRNTLDALDAYALQDLRNRMFSAEEQMRLSAYEHAGALLPGLP